jgi:hypothetical protein
MPFIEVDLQSTPDKFPQLPAGIYTVTVDSASVEPVKDNPEKHKVVVKMSVKDSQDEKLNGMTVYDHLSLSQPIGLKHLWQSCGFPLTSKGINTEDMIGKTAKIRVTVRTYPDKTTGEIKESPNISEYMH